MTNQGFTLPNNTEPRFYYGYVVVTAAFTIMLVGFGFYQSFGVFFKPMSSDFSWSRALTSGAFSLSHLIRGLMGIIVGGFTDKLGARIVLTLCGFLIGSGFFTITGCLGKREVQLPPLQMVPMVPTNEGIVFEMKVNGKDIDSSNDIIITKDGGYMIAGYTYSKGEGKGDAYLAKFSASGQMEWDKTYGTPENDQIYSVVQTADGGYAADFHSRSHRFAARFGQEIRGHACIRSE